MTIESATYINQLNSAYPATGDQVAEGDDHIRLIKAVLKATFGNSGAYPSFPANTRLMFAQAAAPTGWTQVTDTNADNRMLRVVAGAGAGVGGSNSPILMNVVPSHTHTITTGQESADHTHTGSTSNDSPGHTHSFSATTSSNGEHQHKIPVYFRDGSSTVFRPSEATPGNYSTPSAGDHTHTVSGNTGGVSANHTHTMTTGGRSAGHTHNGTTDGGSSATNWTPKYIDLILCSKN